MALAHSLFGERINWWLLQLRKANAAVVLATQSLAQLEALPHRHTILDSCVTRIFLPNADAPTPSAAPLYRALGLNDRAIRTIVEATPKRQYYITSPRGSRLFELGLGEVARAFLTAMPGETLDETRRRVECLADRVGDTWPARWLAERGLGDWAERWQVLGDRSRAARGISATEAPTETPNTGVPGSPAQDERPTA